MILFWNELLCPVLSSSSEGCDLAAFSVAVVLPQNCLLSPASELASGENEVDNFVKYNLLAIVPAHFSCLAPLFFLINLFVTPPITCCKGIHLILSKNAAASFVTGRPDGQSHTSTTFLHNSAICDQHCPQHSVLNSDAKCVQTTTEK